MKKLFFGIICLLLCGNVFSAELAIDKTIILDKPIIEDTQDYWVYVRLEDRSGVTESDDVGRSKAGDVIAVLPVNKQNIPSATEKRSYMIYKATLTEAKRSKMLEPMTEQIGIDEDNNPIFKKIAYRKNKLDTSKLGITVKKGLVVEKIDATKIETNIKTQTDLNVYRVKQIAYATLGRPLIKLANIITRKAWAETVSTINKTGEDYNTLTLWEDDKDGDLVTDTRQETAECYDDDGTLTDQLSIGGSATSSSYFMKVTAPIGERHNGTAGTGFTLTSTAMGPSSSVISITDRYTIIEWIEITDWKAASFWIWTFGVILGSDSSYSHVRNILMYDVSETSSRIFGFYTTDQNATNVYVYNNIIYGIKSGWNNNGVGIYYPYKSDFYYYNNTIYDCENGLWINTDGSTVHVKNNISIGNAADDYVFQSTTDHDYNASSDSTATGANSVTGITTAIFESITAGSEDLHLVSGASTVRGAGVNLYSTFTTDIDGDTRPSTGAWDIGADEYQSLSTFTPKVMIF